MREILKQIGSSLREAGFKGSGRNFSKLQGDFVFVINMQASRGGDGFYVNLGAQPVFVPSESGPVTDPKMLKEYQCILRKRVGARWAWRMSATEFSEFMAKLQTEQRDFFTGASRLRTAIASQSSETLLTDFCSGTTRARATLHLARACAALGHKIKALELVKLGCELAGPRGSSLRASLKAVMESVDRGGSPTSP